MPDHVDLRQLIAAAIQLPARQRRDARVSKLAINRSYPPSGSDVAERRTVGEVRK